MADSQDKTPPLSAAVFSSEGQTLQTQHDSALSAPVDPAATRIPSPTETLPVAGTAGQTIAGYVIEGELGRGGMGVVYRARQPGLNRVVALKMILHADHAGSEDRLRFRREAESLAKLRHENIVQVYEVGEHEGRPFICLEYVEGGSLDRHLKGTPLPPLAAARLVRQLAEGVQAAHEAGIIHRDLKPANVLLASGGREPPVGGGTAGLRPPLATPKITDFGLAKKQDEGGLSVSGAVMGTPSYMAPEQAAGKSKDIDPRTDVYALGAILYECLTGRPPFRAATAMDTMLQVMHDEAVSVRSLQPATPMDIETICLKCLQKEPGRRYFTARELADDLGRFTAGEPVQARPVGRLERGWRWARRNPTTAGLLASIALLLLTVAGVSSVLGRLAWLKAEEAEFQAAEARVAREGEASKAADERKARLQAQRSEKNAVAAREEATKKAREEAAARIKADLEEQKAKRLLYASRLALVQSLWSEGKVLEARSTLEEQQEYRHTWEHRYLNTLLYHHGQRTFLGHTNYVGSVSFSSDGKRIASGSDDGTVKVWDTAGGQELLTLKGHTDKVTSVSFSPDGKHIASASDDGTVKVWDAATGQHLHTLKGHADSVRSVSFSPDGKRIASGSEDRTVKVWDAAGGQELLTLTGHTESVWCVSFSPDSKRIASGSRDHTAKVWDAATGQTLLTLRGHNNVVSSLSFSPDGKRIASASWDRTMKVWGAATGQHLLTIKDDKNVVSGVSFSPDGKRIASGGGDKLVKVWDAAGGHELLALKGHTNAVRGVSFSPDGKCIASASFDRTVKVWDAVGGQDSRTLKGHTQRVWNVAFSPDSKRIASGSDDRTLKVWDTAGGQELLSLKGHTLQVSGVSFSPDGKRIATGSWDKTVKVWDAEGGQELLTLKGHTLQVNCVSFSPDGKRIASASDDRTVKMWDAVSGKELLTFKGHSGVVSSVTFSPDGKRIASASGDRTVKLWDAATGQELLTLRGHTSYVSCVSFSPDGKRIATGNGDNTAKVWDAVRGRFLLTLRGHTGAVRSVSFSPDSKRIATGSFDHTVKVWDALSGQDLLTLKRHTDLVNSVSFSPDGTRLASGSVDHTVKLWDAAGGLDVLTLRGHAHAVSSVSFSPDSKRVVSRDVEGAQATWDLATGHRIAATVPKTVPASPLSPDGRFLAVVEGSVIRVHCLPDGKQEEAAGWRWWVDPDPRWHELQAQESWQAAEWFAAAFHLERLLRERPWDAELSIRLSYALGRLGQSREAAVHHVRAIILQPRVNPWPLDPQAAARGRKAAEAGDRPRALAEFELAVHQPIAPFVVWTDYLLAARAAGSKDAPRICGEVLDRFERKADVARSLLFSLRTMPCNESETARLVKLAEGLVAVQRNVSNLNLLGSALYRAGRFEEAVRTLEESIELHGKGGYVDTWLFLAMTQQRLGQAPEARRNLDRFEAWLKGRKVDTWQERERWRLLNEEARALILAMPRTVE